MWIVEQLSSRTFYHYLSFWSTLLVKMCPIFDGSASNHFTRYQKILWVCSLECKKLLNFICLTMKFHNRHYPTLRAYILVSWDFFLIATTAKMSQFSICFRFYFSVNLSSSKSQKRNGLEEEEPFLLFVSRNILWSELFNKRNRKSVLHVITKERRKSSLSNRPNIEFSGQ